MDENIFSTSLVDINYIEGPNNGQPILLLHGSPYRWQIFMPIIPDLIKQYHLYAIDFRGHGKSGRTPGAYQLQDYLLDVIAFIKNIIKKPVIIFGHSLGGMIAAMLAANHPELVQSIIMGDAPLTLEFLRKNVDHQMDVAHRCINWLRTNEVEKIYHEIRRDDMAASITFCDPEMIEAMFDRFDDIFSEYNTDKIFPMIQCPTLIIRGNLEKGSFISDSDLDRTSKLIHDLSDVKISTVGHFLMEDRPSLIKEIEAFTLDCTFRRRRSKHFDS